MILRASFKSGVKNNFTDGQVYFFFEGGDWVDKYGNYIIPNFPRE